MNDVVEQAQNPEEGAEDATFAALAKAVAEGDTETLNRLMAGDDVEVKEPEVTKTEEENEETSEEEDASTTEEEESEQPQESAESDPEAAKSAASTSETKDPNEDKVTIAARELHALRSDVGRLRGAQSRMQQLEQELRALRARAQQNGQSDTSTKKELPAELQKKLDNLKKIDPDLAETFEAVVGMVQGGNQDTELAVTEKLYEQAELDFFHEQRAELLQAVPQADKIFAAPQWTEWKKSLTPGQRAMAESGHAVDVIRAIHAFAADMKAQKGQVSQSGTSSEGGDPNATKAPTQPVTQPKSEVTEARNRKIQTSVAAKSPAAKQTKELDENALFAEYYNTLAKANHIK